jgi:hypothetical protein
MSEKALMRYVATGERSYPPQASFAAEFTADYEALVASSFEQLADESTPQYRVLQRLRKPFDTCVVLDTLIPITDGELYIFGGTVRRALFDNTQYGDLDIMVPNGDNRLFEGLDALCVPVELNRQGHHRYRWGAQQIDAFQPREFYSGFQDVEHALRYFDLRINATHGERSIDQYVSGGQFGSPGVEDIIEALWGTRVSPSIDGVRPEHLRDDRCLVPVD